MIWDEEPASRLTTSITSWQKAHPALNTSTLRLLFAITTSPALAFMLLHTPRRCATRHKPDIQRYKGRAGSQIAALFEQAA
jgi:hypothetical protein